MLESDGGECGAGMRGRVEVAWWGIHGHGRLKSHGSVSLVRTGIYSVSHFSQKCQTNCNNKRSLHVVMMVQVRVGDEGSRCRWLGHTRTGEARVVVHARVKQILCGRQFSEPRKGALENALNRIK